MDSDFLVLIDVAGRVPVRIGNISHLSIDFGRAVEGKTTYWVHLIETKIPIAKESYEKLCELIIGDD